MIRCFVTPKTDGEGGRNDKQNQGCGCFCLRRRRDRRDGIDRASQRVDRDLQLLSAGLLVGHDQPRRHRWVATGGTGTLDVPGYAPQELVLITPSALGYESPPGYRANDGTDWFGINQNVPIDSDGLLFDVGTSSPVWGGFPIFPIYASGPGTRRSGLFGHIDGGPEFYEYNVATTLAATATPEPGTWAMLLMGFAGVAFVGYRNARQRSAAA